MKNSVIDQLYEISEVKDISKTTGEFDILAKIMSENEHRLNHIVVWKIKKRACVTDVMSLSPNRK